MYLHYYYRSKIWKLSSNDSKWIFIIVWASFRIIKNWRLGSVSSTPSMYSNWKWWVRDFAFSLQINIYDSVFTEAKLCALSGRDGRGRHRFAAGVHETKRISWEEFSSSKEEGGEGSANPPSCLHAHHAGNKPFLLLKGRRKALHKRDLNHHTDINS